MAPKLIIIQESLGGRGHRAVYDTSSQSFSDLLV